MNDTKVGGYIKQLRKNNGVKLQDMAKNMDMDVSLLSRYERGIQVIGIKQLRKCILYYGANEELAFTFWLQDIIETKLKDVPTHLVYMIKTRILKS